ncbi:hypothetical protein ABIB57_001168 [Devosia sp. UYZn731]
MRAAESRTREQTEALAGITLGGDWFIHAPSRSGTGL